MTKTDVQLQRDVIDELRFDPRVAAEVDVEAYGGIVTLSGQVESFAKKHAAVRAAERVAGAYAVADTLTVALPSAFRRTDTDVAHSVLTALRWDIEVPNEMISGARRGRVGMARGDRPVAVPDYGRGARGS